MELGTASGPGRGGGGFENDPGVAAGLGEQRNPGGGEGWSVDRWVGMTLLQTQMPLPQSPKSVPQPPLIFQPEMGRGMFPQSNCETQAYSENNPPLTLCF